MFVHTMVKNRAQPKALALHTLPGREKQGTQVRDYAARAYEFQVSATPTRLSAQQTCRDMLTALYSQVPGLSPLPVEHPLKKHIQDLRTSVKNTQVREDVKLYVKGQRRYLCSLMVSKTELSLSAMLVRLLTMQAMTHLLTALVSPGGSTQNQHYLSYCYLQEFAKPGVGRTPRGKKKRPALPLVYEDGQSLQMVTDRNFVAPRSTFHPELEYFYSLVEGDYTMAARSLYRGDTLPVATTMVYLMQYALLFSLRLPQQGKFRYYALEDTLHAYFKLLDSFDPKVAALAQVRETRLVVEPLRFERQGERVSTVFPVLPGVALVMANYLTDLSESAFIAARYEERLPQRKPVYLSPLKSASELLRV